jgi:hypothetical protein
MGFNSGLKGLRDGKWTLNKERHRTNTPPDKKTEKRSSKPTNTKQHNI